jgi:hypothetical protein
MIDNAEWAVLGEIEDGEMRVQVQMQTWWDELGFV